MQHIPHTNLEEKHVWPDLTLTGEDIHRAYFNVCPEGASKQWDDVEEIAREMYAALATELNRELDGRQAWFEGEDTTITAVKCPSCGAMISDLKNHPCL